jgi:hypothetical protein
MLIREIQRCALGALAAMLLLAANAPAATLVIDAFTDSSVTDTVSPYPDADGFKSSGFPLFLVPQVTSLATAQVVTDTNNGGVVAGGTRGGSLAWVSGSNRITASIDPAGAGTFNISSLNDTGFVRLDYSVASGYQAPGAGGLLLTNLSSFSSILMDVDFFNPGVGNGELVTLVLEDGDSISAALAKPVALGPITWSLSDAAFAGITMSDIRRVHFEFQISQGTDIIVDFVQAQDVPEPGSLLLWSSVGVGLLIGACVMRRRKR